MVYGKAENFNKYCESMVNAPETTVQGASDLAKPFVCLLVMKNIGKLNDADADCIIQHIYIKFLSFLAAKEKYLDVLKISNNEIIDKAKEEIVKDFNKYITLGDLKRAVDQKLSDMGKSISFCPVSFNISKLEKTDQKSFFGNWKILF